MGQVDARSSDRFKPIYYGLHFFSQADQGFCDHGIGEWLPLVKDYVEGRRELCAVLGNPRFPALLPVRGRFRPLRNDKVYFAPWGLNADIIKGEVRGCAWIDLLERKTQERHEADCRDDSVLI